MTSPQNSILVDCERMKYPYTGLYYYCLHLSKNLLTENKEHLRLCFYIPPSAQNIFGKNACYIPQHSLHKMVLPHRSFNLWHCTYQGTHYYPWRKKMKVLFTIHDINFMYDAAKPAAKKNKYLSSLKAKIDRADHIVAISEFTLNDVKQHIDLSHKPCSVIYNGSNIEALPVLQPPVHTPSAPFFFTIGTIVSKKNFHVLPALLLHNNIQLLIAGITQSEAYKNKIIEIAKSMGVADRVLFTGSISENDKQWYLKNCAAFVFPSISEGFGLPVVEAMHFGKPLILAKATSLPEIGGIHAAYFDNFEPEHMNALARKTIEEHTPEKAGHIRQWSQRFQWASSAQQYLKLYTQLLEM